MRLKLNKSKVFKVALIVCLLVSSLFVIYSSHLSRDRFNRFEKLKRVESQLMVQWHRLLLEESAWSSLVRIERMAVERMKMKAPNAYDIQVVSK